MAFVANQAIFKVNQELLAMTAAHPAVHCKVDCYNIDRRVACSVPASYDRPFSPSPFASSPMDDFGGVYAPAQHFPGLIAAFSAAFPDFDFSTAYPWNFKLIPSPEQAQAKINWAFQTELPDCEQTLAHLWMTLEKEISPALCSIYSYEPDRPDAFSECGAIFNMCYFFLNDKTNRVVLVHLMEGGELLDSGSENEDFDEGYGFSVF